MPIKILIIKEEENAEPVVLYSFKEKYITVHKNFTKEEFFDFLPTLKSVTDDIEDFGENYLSLDAIS